MGRLLISRRSVHDNKVQKRIQKEYLKAHHRVRARYPKAKLGKVVERKSETYLECTKETRQSESQTIEHENVVNRSMLKKEKYQPDEIMAAIQLADIRGMSGSGFPTIKKIKTVKASQAAEKYLIVNAVACDPGLIHDEWILRKYQDEIKTSINALDKIIGFKKVIIATPEIVPCKYPMGAERILISQLLGVDIPQGIIPAEIGYLVLNVQTLYAVYKALYAKEVILSKYITLANIETGAAYVAKVSIGETIEEVLARLQSKENINRYKTLSTKLRPGFIFSGGGVMDAEEVKLSDKISERTNFIGFGNPAEFDDTAKCKGCGACTRNCPENVNVRKIIRALGKGALSNLEQYNIENCIGCGTCSYYCKAGKNTMGIIQKLKGQNHEA